MKNVWWLYLQAKSSIGSPLVIEGEEYDDLDEVIYRFIHPFVDHARELVVSCCSAHA